MKPTFPAPISSPQGEPMDRRTSESPKGPITDYNYYSVPFNASNTRYASAHPRSFWKITGDYFENEARYDFLGEAALWIVLAITASLPLMSNAGVLIEFVRGIGSF